MQVSNINRSFNGHYVLIFAIFTALIVAGIYAFFFYDYPFGNSTDFGAFGDFFGGTLNPILALLTIWFLVYSTNLQRAELTAVIKEAESNNRIQELIAKQNVDAMTLPDISKSIEKNLSELSELINRREISTTDGKFFSIYEASIVKDATYAASQLADRVAMSQFKELDIHDQLAWSNCAGIYERLRFLYLSLREYQERGGALSFQKYIIDIAIAHCKTLLACRYEELNTGPQLKQFENIKDGIELKMQKLNIEAVY